MAYFNHAFQKVFVGTEGFVNNLSGQLGTPGNILQGGQVAFVNPRDWQIQPINGAPANCCPLILAAGSIYQNDKIGPFHGGYQESNTSKVINPKYVSQFYRVDPCLPQNEVVHVGNTQFIAEENPNCCKAFFCGVPEPIALSSSGDAKLPRASRAASTTPADAGTECALLYTSGSTGKPKCCMLSNAYFTGFGHWYASIGGWCELRPGEERLITPLPLSHMNAMATSAMGMIETGGCIVQLDRFHPSSWWASVRESGATVVHYLGVMPAILLGMPEAPTDDVSGQVRFGFGAGVNPRHHAAFEQRFGLPAGRGLGDDRDRRRRLHYYCTPCMMVALTRHTHSKLTHWSDQVC